MATVLSGVGLCALMSFTVSQRTGEIGLRTALGAGSGRIFVAIARRAFLQLVADTIVGIGAGYWFINEIVGTTSEFVIDPALILVGCAAFMFLVGMLACVVPTLRGLRIRPVEALQGRMTGTVRGAGASRGYSAQFGPEGLRRHLSQCPSRRPDHSGTSTPRHSRVGQ